MILRDSLAEAAGVLNHAAEAIDPRVMESAIDAIVGALSSGKALLVCGNGGSAADAMHITCELVGRFLEERRALRVICLSENPAVLTAWSNDHSFDTVFARQVEAYGEKDAVLLGISTLNITTNFRRTAMREVSDPGSPAIISSSTRSGAPVPKERYVGISRATASALPRCQGRQAHFVANR
jgi:phosphoheptose isomerase